MRRAAPTITTETLVVGGGVAGLYASYLLGNCLVVEQLPRLGGRIHTDQDGFDTGASRVHGSHSVTIDLCERLGIQLVSADMPQNTMQGARYDGKTVTIRPEPKDAEPQPGLSTFDARTLAEGFVAARQAEENGGYDDSSRSDPNYEYMGTSNPYGTVPPGEPRMLKYKNGMSELIRRLARKATEERGCRIKTSTALRHVEATKDGKLLAVLSSSAPSADPRMAVEKVVADRVVLAIPAYFARQLPFLERSCPHLNCVWETPLCRVKFSLTQESAAKVPDKGVYYVTDTVGSKIIIEPRDNSAGSGSCHLYASADRARFWRDLQAVAGGRLAEEVQKVVSAYNSELVVSGAPKVFFWRMGSEILRPALRPPKSDKRRFRWQDWVRPHPVRFPQLYMAGTSLSSMRGWVQGALLSVREMVSQMRSVPRPIRVRPGPGMFVADGGRVCVEYNERPLWRTERRDAQDAWMQVGFV